MIIGIDPGTTESGYTFVDSDYKVIEADKVLNADLLRILRHDVSPSDTLAVESIQSYGMPVGREVFETAYLIGRIQQVADYEKIECVLYPRPEYAKSICGTNKVKDSTLRQALLLRFGGDKKGEPLNMLKGSTDKRSAYAVAVYHLDVLRYR